MLRGKLFNEIYQVLHCVLINQSQNSEAILYFGETRNV